VQNYDLKAGGSILKYRWRKDADRRAEVIFAIQGPGEQIWLHTKHRYNYPIYRLPSGGVEWEESVEGALRREIQEETALASFKIQRFIGLLEYRFHHSDSYARFASYLFLVSNPHGKLVAPEGSDEVAEFRPILPRQLPQVSADLRNVIGDRREWGHWRAIAHDVLYEALVGGQRK
jgi:ADP-ribose pyrophosphatase YjhB (NUDIX family)